MYLFSVALFALAVASAVILLVLRFFFKGVKLFKSVDQRAEEDEDYFRRVSTKHYHEETQGTFDSDYFSRDEEAPSWQEAARQKGEQAAQPSKGGDASAHQTVQATTPDGVVVTIAGGAASRPPKGGGAGKGGGKQKIFSDDEGEYVEFTEEP